MNIKKGIGASPGVAIGPAFVLDTEEYRIPRRTVDESEIPTQIQIIDAAILASRQEIADLKLGVSRKFGAKMSDIFAFHEAIVADPGLRTTIVNMIQSQRFIAAYAFSQAMNNLEREFLGAASAYMKERVRDLHDITKRMLRHILGRAREDITRLSEPVVIVAHDIPPSKAVSFDRDHILAFAINVGGSTSHMAIIARMMDIPAVVALNNMTTLVAGGEQVIVDGSSGLVIASPDEATVHRYRQQQSRNQAKEKQLEGLRDLPATTRDGVRMNLLANIELAEEARSAIEAGAEGIGLYRSEFLFLSGEHLPSEEQQYQVFRGAVRHAQGRPLTIRTIDLGADKLSDHFGPRNEHNPVLGLRSLRYCLHHLDMFKTHLRAILRASAAADVRIMFPMITTLMELRQARSTVQDVMEDLAEDGIPFRKDIPIGMMIETPAAAMLAPAFARECSFLSLGTNDLTQYALAVDRGNERVAYLYAPHNPAVLRLIRDVVRAGDAAGIPVSICGEMAGDPIYCELLLGLGLRVLSMAPQNLLAVKKIIRETTLARCEKIARDVLQFDEDRQVYNYLRDQATPDEQDADPEKRP